MMVQTQPQTQTEQSKSLDSWSLEAALFKAEEILHHAGIRHFFLIGETLRSIMEEDSPQGDAVYLGIQSKSLDLQHPDSTQRKEMIAQLKADMKDLIIEDSMITFRHKLSADNEVPVKIYIFKNPSKYFENLDIHIYNGKSPYARQAFEHDDSIFFIVNPWKEYLGHEKEILENEVNK